jgi:hypothetical protein
MKLQLVDADVRAPDGSAAFAAPFEQPIDGRVCGRAGLFKDRLTPSANLVRGNDRGSRDRAGSRTGASSGSFVPFGPCYPYLHLQ